MQSTKAELESLKEELKPFQGSTGAPSYRWWLKFWPFHHLWWWNYDYSATTDIFSLWHSALWRVNSRQCARRKNYWLSSFLTPSNTRWRSLRNWTLGRWGEREKSRGQVSNRQSLTVPLLFQEDMRLVIVQQVQQREEDRQKERQRERENTVGLQRSKSLRVKGEGGKGFFSSLFKDKWANICLTGDQYGLKLQVIYCTHHGLIHRPHISICICIYVYKKIPVILFCRDCY